jgi:hypothetical protein
MIISFLKTIIYESLNSTCVLKNTEIPFLCKSNYQTSKFNELKFELERKNFQLEQSRHENERLYIELERLKEENLSESHRL